MRQLTDHQVNPANDKLTITVMDEVGSGGAHHWYDIRGYLPATNPSAPEDDEVQHTRILFQNGPINEVGVNGITHEALLVVLADRLRCFQGGAYRNDHNERALAHIEQALAELKARTIARLQRGAEGTHTV